MLIQNPMPDTPLICGRPLLRFPKFMVVRQGSAMRTVDQPLGSLVASMQFSEAIFSNKQGDNSLHLFPAPRPDRRLYRTAAVEHVP